VTQPLDPVFADLRKARLALNLSEEQLDRAMVLGPGWIEGIESGRIIPDLSLFLALCSHLQVAPSQVLSKVPAFDSALSIARTISAVTSPDGITVHFQYAEHSASYEIPNASLAEFEEVILSLRDGLADSKAQKAEAVVRSFQKAVSLWPHVNPSDIWWFVIYRAFTDPYNHPASRYGGDYAQSWIRTSGWALERVFVENYSPKLAKHGIRIAIEGSDEKKALGAQLKTKVALNVDKADVILSLVNKDGTFTCFGVVHVKASFAERRTDDEPMSRLLIESGYCSPLLTMDCKSSPSATPLNRGELASSSGERSDKRKDIEVSGVFSGCFSFNARTEETTDPNAVSQIRVCDFSSTDDAFVEHVKEMASKFRK